MYAKSWREKHTCDKQSFVHRIDFLGCVSSFNRLDLMEINSFMPGNNSEVRDVVWFLVWNGICQCKKKQTEYGCSCLKIKLEISQRQLHECIQQTLLFSIPHQQNLVAHAPLLIVWPHRMASVQKETRPSLSCFCSKTKSKITRIHDHLST